MGSTGRSFRITEKPFLYLDSRKEGHGDLATKQPFYTQRPRRASFSFPAKDTLFWMSASPSTPACGGNSFTSLGVLPVSVWISVCLFLPLTGMLLACCTQQFAEIQQDLWFLLPSMYKHNTLQCLKRKSHLTLLNFLTCWSPHTPTSHKYTISLIQSYNSCGWD